MSVSLLWSCARGRARRCEAVCGQEEDMKVSLLHLHRCPQDQLQDKDLDRVDLLPKDQTQTVAQHRFVIGKHHVMEEEIHIRRGFMS